MHSIAVRHDILVDIADRMGRQAFQPLPFCLAMYSALQATPHSLLVNVHCSCTHTPASCTHFTLMLHKVFLIPYPICFPAVQSMGQPLCITSTQGAGLGQISTPWFILPNQ